MKCISCSCEDSGCFIFGAVSTIIVGAGGAVVAVVVAPGPS